MNSKPTYGELKKEIEVLQEKVKELENSENQFRVIAENTSDVITLQTFDLKSSYTYVSPSAKALTGYEPEELLGKSCFDVIHPEDKKVLLPLLKKFIAYKLKNLIPGKESTFTETIELRIKNKSGKWIYVQSTANIIGNELLFVTRDITDRKQSEKVLQESESQLQTLIGAMPDFVCFKDGDGRWLKTNDASIRIFQLEDTDYQGKKDSELAELNSQLQGALLTCEESDAKAWKKGSRIHAEETLTDPNGLIRVFDVTKMPVFYSDGKRKGLIVLGHDITDHKNAEDLLVKSEKKYRELFEKSKDAILIIHNGKFADCNQATINMLGYNSKDEFLNTHPSELSPERQADGKMSFAKANEMMETALKNGSHRFEWNHKKSNGKIFPVEVLLTAISTDENNQILHTTWRDITERKKAEEEINKLSKVVETTPDAIVITDMKGKIEYVNHGLLALGNYKDDSSIIGKSVFMFSGEEGVKQLKEEIIPTILSEGKWEGELSVKRKDGSIYPADFVSTMILDENGKPKYLLSNFRDITNRKKAEAELRESEQRFRDMANLLPQIVYETDINGNLTFVNKQAFDSFEYSQEEYKKGVNIMNTLIPEDIDRAKENIQNIFCGKETENHEYTALRKDGSTFPILIYASAIFKDNKPIGLRGIIVDITERKNMELKLIRMSDAFRMSIDSIIISNLDGKITDINEATLKMYRTDNKEDLIGKSSFDHIAPEDKEKAIAGMKEVMEKGYVKDRKYNIVIQDGSKIPVEMSVSFMKGMDGEPIGFIGITRDITERKKTEDALRESEERFRQVTESAEEWIWEIDETALYTYASPIIEKLLGYKPEEIVGKKHAYDLFHPNDIEPLKNATLEIFKEKKPFFRFFNRNVHKNGKIVWLSTSGFPILDNKGNLVGYRGADIDITEQKKAEAEIKKHREHLKELVKERTKELEEKNKELERFNNLFVNREFRIKELRDKVKELEKKNE